MFARISLVTLLLSVPDRQYVVSVRVLMLLNRNLTEKILHCKNSTYYFAGDALITRRPVIVILMRNNQIQREKYLFGSALCCQN